MTYINAFEKIKEKLQKVTSANFTRDFAIQVNLTNKDCAGAFYIANLDGTFSVEPYDYRDNSAMITLMMGDFTKLVEGKLDIEKAIESNKLEVVGDMDAVVAISGIVPEQKAEQKKKAAPKAATKEKTQPKKEPVKKAEVPKKETVKKETVKKEVSSKAAPVKKADEKKTTAEKAVKTTKKA